MDREDLYLDREHIIKIELKILNGLEWKMRLVTPFCFVPHFMYQAEINKINFRGISEIIIQAQGDIKFTQYKPSELAAAAILTALHHGLRPRSEEELSDFKDVILKGGIVLLDDGKVDECMEEMHKILEVMRKNQENVPRRPTDGASSSPVAAEKGTNVGASSSEIAAEKSTAVGASSSEIAAEESSTDFKRREGKQIMSEAKEEEKVDKSGPVEALFPEGTDTMNLNFALKWIINQAEYEFTSLNPDLFRPPPETETETKPTLFCVRACLKAMLPCMLTAPEEDED